MQASGDACFLFSYLFLQLCLFRPIIYSINSILEALLTQTKEF